MFSDCQKQCYSNDFTCGSFGQTCKYFDMCSSFTVAVSKKKCYWKEFCVINFFLSFKKKKKHLGKTLTKFWI